MNIPIIICCLLILQADRSEGQVINRAMKKLIKENDLPDVVFHSVRHSSITYKLKWTGGDIKAVQGDSGHARAEMVQDVYSHILDEDRRANARRFDENFYQQKPEEAKEEVPQTETQNKAGVDPTALFQLLADPEMAKAFQNLLTIYQSKAANDKQKMTGSPKGLSVTSLVKIFMQTLENQNAIIGAVNGERVVICQVLRLRTYCISLTQ